MLGRHPAGLWEGLPPSCNMEVLLSILLNVLGFWFATAFLLIVLPSVFGVSLGISQLYIKVLVKTLEVRYVDDDDGPVLERPPSCM